MPTTLLHRAAAEGNTQVILRLLRDEFDPRTLDEEHKLPVYYACINGHINAAQILIDCTNISEADETSLRRDLFEKAKTERVANQDKNYLLPHEKILMFWTGRHLYDSLWESKPSLSFRDKTTLLFEEYGQPKFMQSSTWSNGFGFLRPDFSKQWGRKFLPIAARIVAYLKSLPEELSDQMFATLIELLKGFERELLQAKDYLLSDKRMLALRLKYIFNRLPDLKLTEGNGIWNQYKPMISDEANSEQIAVMWSSPQFDTNTTFADVKITYTNENTIPTLRIPTLNQVKPEQREMILTVIETLQFLWKDTCDIVSSQSGEQRFTFYLEKNINFPENDTNNQYKTAEDYAKATLQSLQNLLNLLNLQPARISQTLVP